MAPNDMVSPWAKLEKRRTPYTSVTPSAPRASWQPYAVAGTTRKLVRSTTALTTSSNDHPPRNDFRTSGLPSSVSPVPVKRLRPWTST